MSKIGWELKEEIDFVETKFSKIFFLKNQNSYDVIMQFQKKNSLKVRTHPKESVDTLFLKIHQQMAELQRLRCEKSEN